MSSTVQGRAASPGVAVAPAFVVAPRAAAEAVDDEPAADSASEHARLDAALDSAVASLEALAERLGDEVGEEQAAIFSAHAAFAADPELANLAHAGIDAGKTAPAAVREAFGTFRDVLAASSDEYLAARAADLDDVAERVVAILTGTTRAVPTQRCIVVARDLAPSDTAELPRDLVAGVVCEAGSPTSHAAILSRSLGIPAVVGATGVLDAVAAGTVLAVDGGSGEVLLDPDAADRDRYEAAASAEVQRREGLASLRDAHGRTADGHPVEVAANVGDPSALERAQAAGAQGSGLVRTEFLFLDAAEQPSIEVQADAYRTVLEAFTGDRVVFRTLDIGADKPVPFVKRPPEDNPALGVRGLRLGLAQPDLLADQLRALLRARAAAGDHGGRLAIMFPMVATLAEIDAAHAALAAAAEAEGTPLDGVEVGIMIEVPAAAIAVRRLARRVDFVSIGTNDLLQYLFAADRLNADVAALPDIFDPDVLRLVAEIAAAAHGAGGWAGVCGEAAADPQAAMAFVGLGIDELSMTPNAVLDAKDALRRHTRHDLHRAAAAAVAAGDAAAARVAFADALR